MNKAIGEFVARNSGTHPVRHVRLEKDFGFTVALGLTEQYRPRFSLYGRKRVEAVEFAGEAAVALAEQRPGSFVREVASG